jgi:hypothetical protein
VDNRLNNKLNRQTSNETSFRAIDNNLGCCSGRGTVMFPLLELADLTKAFLSFIFRQILLLYLNIKSAGIIKCIALQLS